MRKLAVAMMVIAGLGLSACGESSPPAQGTGEASPGKASTGKILATVNGTAITSSDIELASDELGPDLARIPKQARERIVLQYLIEQQLLADAARKEGLDKGEAFQKRLAYYRRKAMRDTYLSKALDEAVTDATLRKLYDKQVKAFQDKEEIRARHILVKTEDEAKAIIDRLKKGADFATLAKEKSTGPSGKKGGDLGYFTEGQMVKPFEEAAFKLKPGEISDPVKTQFGWHVIKVEDRRKQTPPKFEDVKERLAEGMRSRKAIEIVQKLRREAKIEFGKAAQKAAGD